VTSKNLKRDGLNFDNVKYISEESYTQICKRSAVDIRDVLFAMIGTIGNPIVVHVVPDFAIKNVALFKIPEEQESYFLKYYLDSPFVKNKMQSEAKGTTQKFVGLGYLRNFPIHVPDKTIQGLLVEDIKRVENETNHLETIYQQKLDALAELKQSILQKAFSGELTSVTDEIKTDALTANVIAFAYYRHILKRRGKTFGRVKAQKTLHLVESIGGLDLDRSPMKDVAGPNDFQHQLEAEKWAKAEQFFEFVKRSFGPGYDFKKLARFDEMMDTAKTIIAPHREALNKAIDIVLPMDTQQAEVFATVHAAWNNLILDGKEITEEAILFEARENWHPKKLAININKFKKAIRKIRVDNLIPDGTAKRVHGQESML